MTFRALRSTPNALRQKLCNTTHRNPRPVRPVVQLVRELVKHLLQLEEPEQRLHVLRIRRRDCALGAHVTTITFQISAENRVARVALPAADATLAGSVVG